MLVSLVERPSGMSGPLLIRPPVQVQPDVFSVSIDMGIDLIRIKLLSQPIDDRLHLVAAITIIDPPQIDLGIGMPPGAVVSCEYDPCRSAYGLHQCGHEYGKIIAIATAHTVRSLSIPESLVGEHEIVYASRIGYISPPFFRFIAILQVVIYGDYLIDGLLAGILERQDYRLISYPWVIRLYPGIQGPLELSDVLLLCP